ncbi:hypothetical protein [Gynuella sp.]|uniref:hypothetical protein n=1 Tax=Gynuella sp. TaxID=2969146 RepID=UPI003D13BF10
MSQIPTEEDWIESSFGLIKDLDVAHAYDIFIGKSNAEMLPKHKDHVLRRSEDLYWLPKSHSNITSLGFVIMSLMATLGFMSVQMLPALFWR